MFIILNNSFGTLWLFQIEMLKFVPVTNGKLYSQGYTCGNIACDDIVGFFSINRLIFLSTDE